MRSMSLPRPTRLSEVGWEAYAWLIYALPFLFTAIAAPFTIAEKTVMLVSFAIFLPLYFIGYTTHSPKILWIVAVFDLIAIVNSPINPSAASFFIFGAALIANGFDTRTALRVLAAQVVIGLVPAVFGMPYWFYMASVVVSALIGAITIQGRARESANARLRLAQEEVERLAKLAERERIARDMHDLLGHTLSVVVLKTELAQKLIARDPDRAAQEIAEVERIARQGLAEVREAITGYRSSGLAAEIESVRETLTDAGIQTTIEARPVPLAPAQETALSLALREAVTNVIRHAAATSCHIKFYSQDGSALMEVQDDGKGGEAPFGNGLTGMRERINALGGVLFRETERGTRLSIRLPLKAES
jgi:two-component system, NarL family, sensor histidine kinase DesK